MRTGCCNTPHLLQTEANSICINSECDNYLGITTPQKANFFRNTVAITALSFCLLFTFDDYSQHNDKAIVDLASADVQKVADSPDVAKVEQELKTLEVFCPHIVLAQVKIESGNFTSNLFRRTNNMIGMRYPFKRKTAAAGIYIPSQDTIIYGTQKELRKYIKTSNYAVYNDWRDCLADYKLWQQSSYNANKAYLTFLGGVYAEDSLYMEKLKKVAALK